ncbi:MAG: hypothetical protein Q9228_007415 [Teloschistes exilis]
MVATPIVINTFVVFVRLYWFERRFQYVVREARNLRRTRDRSRTRTEALDRRDMSQEELGVRGRSIVVLHNNKTADRKDDGTTTPNAKNIDESEPTSASSSSPADRSRSDETQGEKAFDEHPSVHREVIFAAEADEAGEGVDEVGELRTPNSRLPRHLSPEEHIAFRENQRNPKDNGTLRIPGPRDFDRGHVPEMVAEEDDGGALTRKVTTVGEDSINSTGGPIRRNITIDEPIHPRQRAGTGLSKTSVPSPRSHLPNHEKGTSPNQDDDERPPPPARLRTRTGTFSSLRRSGSRGPEPLAPYLSWQPTIGRNSAFADLTEEQREELGGIEYRSLKRLAIILCAYYATTHIITAVIFVPWIVRTDTFGSIVNNDGISRAWWGIFTSASMFNDVGFTLTPDSMISFQRAVLPLLLGTFVIIIGNTGFPCMLRFVIWLLSKVVPMEGGMWEELKFLLDHPRRCFTLLFPTEATAWLFWILVIFNGIDLILFIVLDLHDPVVTSIGSPGYRILNGLFQASSTRTAGFSTVNISNLHPGIQVSYMIMMYISVFPIAISVRRTNVYEEKSLGIYTSGGEQQEDANEPSYVGAHLMKQLSFDLWYIFLGLFAICVSEGRRLSDTSDYSFTIYSVMFEIVSAYGTVGLSLGYPNVNASFSSQLNTFSKLVIIAMQIRGRHRGLPYELDRAVLLPSETLHKNEDADASRRMQRRNSSLSFNEPIGSGVGHQSTMPRTPTSGTTTGREAPEHSIRDDIMGERGHSGKTNAAVGQLMANIAAGPPLERKDNTKPHSEKVE